MYRFLSKRHSDIVDATKIFSHYNCFNPVIVGTFPIDIAIESSDIDIIMQSDNLMSLKKKLLEDFSEYLDFEISLKEVLVCRFSHSGYPIEVYASNKPVTSLNSYRHLVIEKRLLELFSDKFREAVILLKKSGMKTEPAFAELLDLEGNPYEALLKLERLSDGEIKSYLE